MVNMGARPLPARAYALLCLISLHPAASAQSLGAGTLKGTVYASERIEIHPRARVTADLHAPVLKIEEGAFFQGSCSMTAESAPKLVDMSVPARK